MNKQNTAWGIVLITVGIQATIDQLMTLTTPVSIGIMVLGGFAALAVYLSDKSNWSLLIPVYVLWGIAAIVGLAEWANTNSNLFPATILSLIALPFLGVYLTNREKNRWAIIPAYVLFSIIPIILFESFGQVGDFIPTYVMTVIAIPFLITYYQNKDNWWALIPAYVLLTIGVIVPLTELNYVNDNLIPSFILFAVSAPFLFVYYRNNDNRWALIPGGITAVIGLLLFISFEAAEYFTPILFIGAGLWMLFRKPKVLAEE